MNAVGCIVVLLLATVTAADTGNGPVVCNDIPRDHNYDMKCCKDKAGIEMYINKKDCDGNGQVIGNKSHPFCGNYGQIHLGFQGCCGGFNNGTAYTLTEKKCCSGVHGDTVIARDAQCCFGLPVKVGEICCTAINQPVRKNHSSHTTCCRDENGNVRTSNTSCQDPKNVLTALRDLNISLPLEPETSSGSGTTTPHPGKPDDQDHMRKKADHCSSLQSNNAQSSRDQLRCCHGLPFHPPTMRCKKGKVFIKKSRRFKLDHLCTQTLVLWNETWPLPEMEKITVIKGRVEGGSYSETDTRIRFTLSRVTIIEENSKTHPCLRKRNIQVTIMKPKNKQCLGKKEAKDYFLGMDWIMYLKKVSKLSCGRRNQSKASKAKLKIAPSNKLYVLASKV